MDYKDIFESVFESASPEELGCFIRNENVPFEYCERALKRKGFGWQNKLLVAMRKDCPLEVFVKLCRNAGERFVSNLFSEMRVLPEPVIREFFKKDWMIYALAQYWRLPDDIKTGIFEKLLVRDEFSNIVNYNYSMSTFLEHQAFLPDDCWKDIDKVLEIYRKKQNTWDGGRNIVEIVRPMRTPLDDDYAMKIIDDSSIRNRTVLLKLAANPSISDYAMMELRVKCPEHVIEDVNEILVVREHAREEYRRTHK